MPPCALPFSTVNALDVHDLFFLGRALLVHFADELVRQLLHADEMTGGTDPHLAEAIELIFHRAELLRKAILFVVLSAACAGLLVLTSTLGAIFDLDLDTAKHVFLLASVAMIVISTAYFSLEVGTSLKALGISVHH